MNMQRCIVCGKPGNADDPDDMGMLRDEEGRPAAILLEQEAGRAVIRHEPPAYVHGRCFDAAMRATLKQTNPPTKH